jgi:hypothetical protein
MENPPSDGIHEPDLSEIDDDALEMVRNRVASRLVELLCFLSPQQVSIWKKNGNPIQPPDFNVRITHRTPLFHLSARNTLRHVDVFDKRSIHAVGLDAG